MSTNNSQNAGKSFDYSNMDISYSPSTGSSPAPAKADSVKETSKYDVGIEYDVPKQTETAPQAPAPEPVQAEPEIKHYEEPVVVSAVSEPEVEAPTPAPAPEDDGGFVVPSDFTKKVQYPTNPEPEAVDEVPEAVSLTGDDNGPSEVNPLFDADDEFIGQNPLVDTDDVDETPDVPDDDEDDDWTSKFEPKFEDADDDADDLEDEPEPDFGDDEDEAPKKTMKSLSDTKKRQKTKRVQKVDENDVEVVDNPKKPFSSKRKKTASSKKKDSTISHWTQMLMMRRNSRTLWLQGMYTLQVSTIRLADLTQ